MPGFSQFSTTTKKKKTEIIKWQKDLFWLKSFGFSNCDQLAQDIGSVARQLIMEGSTLHIMAGSIWESEASPLMAVMEERSESSHSSL